MQAIETLAAYVPEDRRRALASGSALPDRAEGSVLAADISGFTRLTATLRERLGARRGAEEVPHHLNRVYDALITAVEAQGGSVIGFSGDAITCFFDRDDGIRAVSCGHAMQHAMRAFKEMSLGVTGPAGEPLPLISLSLKVSVATGPVRRFMVGDPEVQLLDVLAGRTLARLDELNSRAESGAVIYDHATAYNLSAAGLAGVDLANRGIPGTRPAPVHGEGVHGEGAHGEGAYGEGAHAAAAHTEGTDARAALSEVTTPEEALYPWLLSPVRRRLLAGQGEFLTELRPVAALFLQFAGIDYDLDPEAGEKLDELTRWVQGIATEVEGSLLQLTIGDKGSYLYVAFGAPVSHEDDARRAAAAALRLRHAEDILGFVDRVHIGLAYGTMRTGAYGSSRRRTYGALSAETNLAARLMTVAASGSIVASEAFRRRAGSGYDWRAVSGLVLRGLVRPVTAFELKGVSESPQPSDASSGQKMIGRQAELSTLAQAAAAASGGKGQLVGVTGEAGMGKSRLIAEGVAATAGRGFEVFTGACQSHETSSPYRVWKSVFHGLLALDAEALRRGDTSGIERALLAVDESLVSRAPLLGAVLDVTLPESDLVRSLSPELRSASREALLIELLRHRARQLGQHGRTLVLVLEDLHWIDPLSRELLATVSRIAADLSLLVLMSYRPLDRSQPLAADLSGLAGLIELRLDALAEAEAAELLEQRFAQLSAKQSVTDSSAGHVGALGQLTTELRQRLLERSEGNPFYLEELLNYLVDSGPVGGQVELPASLHGLILGRIDKLGEEQQAALKVASVIGRSFPFDWLSACLPDRRRESVLHDLETLRELDLTPLERDDPPVYMFKHALTRDVAYDSLTRGSRETFHGRLADYIEGSVATRSDPQLGLLAFHYEQSGNSGKKREYLRRAGDSAKAAYANEAAIDYYRRLLPLTRDAERASVLLAAGEVAALTGDYHGAEAAYHEALELSDAAGSSRELARARRLLGELFERRGDHHAAKVWLEQAGAASRGLGDQHEVAAVLLALGGNVLWNLGEYDAARSDLNEALGLARSVNDLGLTARSLHGLANIDLYQGRSEAAKARFEESLRLRREAGDYTGVANSLNNLAIIAANEGDFDSALRQFNESLDLRRKTGDRSGVAIAFNNLGFMASQRGEVEQAKELFEKSLGLRRELDDKLGTAVSLNSLGDLARQGGEDTLAADRYRESLRLSTAIGNVREAATGLIGLAALAVKREANPVALRLTAAAEALLASIGAVMDEPLRECCEAVAAAVNNVHGTAVAEAARSEGSRLSLEQAAELALATA